NVGDAGRETLLRLFARSAGHGRSDSSASGLGELAAARRTPTDARDRAARDRTVPLIRVRARDERLFPTGRLENTASYWRTPRYRLRASQALPCCRPDATVRTTPSTRCRSWYRGSQSVRQRESTMAC